MTRRRAAWLLLTALALGGCDGFDLVSKTALSSPGSPEEGKKFLVDALDYWVGRSKDERVRVFGAPLRCQKLEAAEVCEWKTTRQLVAFTYDTGGIARAWSYRGEYGQFTNANHERMRPTAIATTKKADQAGQKKEWIHPTKSKDDFNRDFYHCRGVLENDPKMTGANLALQSGKDFYSDEQMEACLKKEGWTQQ